jgi:PAS domain S-box-containing protein
MTNKNLLRILFVEDLPSDAELAVLELRKEGLRFEHIRVETREEFIKALNEFRPDIIISDYMLPSYNGLQALTDAREFDPLIPFVLYTGSMNEETAVECIKAGATDYVIKEHMTRLPFAVKEALEQHRVQIEKRASELLLKENEEKLQSIFSAAPVGIGLVVGKVFIEVNDTFCKMTGFNRMELLGKNAEAIYAKDEQNESAGIVIYRHIAEKGTGSVETRFKCKDGRILNIFLSSIPLDKNDLTKGVTFIAMDITERVKAEEELANEKYLIYSLMSTLPDHIYFKDLKSRFIRINKAHAQFFGLDDPLLAVGKTDADFFSGEHATQAYEDEQKIIRTGKSISLEEKETHPDRPDTWVSTIKMPLKDKDGNIIGTFGISRDITERKLAEETINILAKFPSENPDPVLRVDMNGRLLYANEASYRVLTLKLQIGKKIPSVLRKVIAEAMKGGIKKIIDTEHDQRIISFNIVPVEEAGYANLYGRDITERKLAEAKLLQSYVFSESLLKTIPFGMDIVDETGTVLFQSDNFKRLFGEEAIGEKCWEIYRDDKKQCSDCPLIKGISIGETEAYESHGVLNNRIFEISHTGMMYNGKRAMLEIFQDITERIVKEEELIKSKEKAEESERLKSAFLTNMSHEIRTPMNGIIGFTELLKEPHLTVEEQQSFIQTIGISGARMLNTINSIVDMSRIESGHISVNIKETNINEKIEFIYKFFKPEVESKGLQFSFKTSLPAKDVIINTDNEKIYGILSNLVRNAIKFTYKGSIEFGYHMVKTQHAASLQFFVKDTGIGIQQNQKELIFERFRQGSESHDRSFEGSGLGLSICKSYVEMLGGKIWVESEEGKGSIFYFTIPYNAVTEQTSVIENVVSTENKEVQIKKLKILVVEDDEISYSLLTRTLQKISKDVLHAITGVEAVELCQMNPDIDLVLMDIRMPRMNGLEATQQIRQFNRDVIIIAQSAYRFSGDSEKALEAGCNDYIAKPVNKTLLYEVINNHFKNFK